LTHCALKVPGLAENRPSVLLGDSVFVTVGSIEYHIVVAYFSSKLLYLRRYEGKVHQVQLDELDLWFHPQFDGVFRLDVEYQVFVCFLLSINAYFNLYLTDSIQFQTCTFTPHA
jgi:hypothetical protein